MNINAFIEENALYRLEGEYGIRNLCKIVSQLGYHDETHFGQFENGSYGDLIVFLEDNPGAAEAIMDWVRDNYQEFFSEEEE